MAEIILGFHYDIGRGGRDVYEDRVKVAALRTAAGLELTVAIVADGVGGRDAGERAAQLAVDTVLSELKRSQETAVPSLLQQAISEANRVVWQEATSHPDKYAGASTTLAVAVVQNGERLFVANVGDSRVYLCRGEKVSQLTLDHTFANLMPLEGRLSWEAARENPNAEAVMRALGVGPQVAVDIGFYVNTIDMRQAYGRGRKGIPLQAGDTVLVCSDGLVKNDLAGMPYILDEEIAQVVNSQEGNRAAKTLIAFALGRDADDNLSVALLQTADPERLARAVRADRRPKQVMGGIVLATLLLLVGMALFFQRRLSAATRDAMMVAHQATAVLEATREASVYEQTAVAATVAARPSMTPSPTPRPQPMSEQGQIAFYYTASATEPIAVMSFAPVLEASEDLELFLNHTDGRIENGRVYVAAGSQLELDQVGDDGVEIELDAGGDLWIETGGYEAGVRIELSGSAYHFSVSGSCMSVDYTNEEEVIVACYEGTCRYQVQGFREQPQIFAGQSIKIDLAEMSFDWAQRPLNLALIQKYSSLIPDSNSGLKDKARCLAPYLPATATTTPIIVPTMTWAPSPVVSGSAGLTGGNESALPTEANSGGVDIAVTETATTAVPKATTATPFPSLSPTLMATEAATPISTIRVSPTIFPTAVPTILPTSLPTTLPTIEPTLSPTTEVTEVPTAEPTATIEPTPLPSTAEPTAVPTAMPTTAVPTSVPTVPTPEPTALPATEVPPTPTIETETEAGTETETPPTVEPTATSR